MATLCSQCHNSGIKIVTTTWAGMSNSLVHETFAELCDCPAGQAVGRGIEEGIRDLEAGHVTPWEDVKRELGLTGES